MATYVIKRTIGRITDNLCQLWEGEDLPTFSLGRRYEFSDRAVAERVMWRLQAKYAESFETEHFPALPIAYEIVTLGEESHPVVENECLCGGTLKWYDGALGYEAMRCVKCWEDWHYYSDNPNEHQEHIQRYLAGERNFPVAK